VTSPEVRATESAAELRRRAACSVEPIRVPGAIQPHGVLLAVSPETSTIVQVSDNTATLLGRASDELLGRPLSAVMEATTERRVMAALARGAGEAVGLRVEARRFEAVAHSSADGMTIVELEPVDRAAQGWSEGSLHACSQRLFTATSVDELRAAAVREVRALTGYDRVAIYHFHPDGHGEVVAEDHAEGLEPYLGLHFPASDIPAQARQLYVESGARAVATNDYQPAELVPRDNPVTGAPTDLGMAALRSVSPHHLTYMSNMGVAASMSVSMVHDGELIGMISCSHQSPRRVPYSLSRGCHTLARQVTLQLRALEEVQRLTHRLARQPIRESLAGQVADGDDTGSALLTGPLTVLDLVAADGAVVRLDGRCSSIGRVPPPEQVTALLEHLTSGPDPISAVQTEALGRNHPHLAAAVPSVTGLLALPLGTDGDYLLWFRDAVSQDVDWLGDQTPGNRVTPLSPRTSFSSWRQTVTDNALPWSVTDVDEATALGDDLLRLIAQQDVRRALARAALAAAVASELAETLDAQVAASRLARLVVPALADWAVVTLVEDSDHADARRVIRDAASWHVEPSSRALAETYASLRLGTLEPTSFLRRALDTGRAVSVIHGATEAITDVLRPGAARQVLRELAPESFAVIPLLGRTRTLGLLTIYNGAARGALTVSDLATADDIAARAGLALDNARLYRTQRQLAEAFQRSLLTDPPQTDHLQIVARYVPAAEAAKVGGDWYDAFTQLDGATVVVIGDVVGHDTVAAAAMGQLRSLIRGIAVATGAGPATLLRQVDTAMAALGAPTIATAVIAVIEQDTDERALGRTRVTWSNAGHPDPMVLAPDGVVTRLVGDHRNLLLGVAADAPRTQSTRTLEHGTTLLLYTDGLVERRTADIRDDMARLHAVLDELPQLELDALTDEILTRMIPPNPADDVAVIAVRLGG
jgi:serine phosphatase RsbU (regulator of sigma subunit)